MAATDWQRAFDDPIPLPRGRQLVTLRDAAGGKPEHDRRHCEPPPHKVVADSRGASSYCQYHREIARRPEVTAGGPSPTAPPTVNTRQPSWEGRADPQAASNMLKIKS